MSLHGETARAHANGPKGRVLEAIAVGEELLTAERRAIFSGDFNALGPIAERKLTVLASLDATVPQVVATPDLKAALAGLVRGSRANEGLLKAARSGLTAARRKIAAIEATRRGDVAYLANGSRIVSQADTAKKTKQA